MSGVSSQEVMAASEKEQPDVVPRCSQLVDHSVAHRWHKVARVVASIVTHMYEIPSGVFLTLLDYR